MTKDSHHRTYKTGETHSRLVQKMLSQHSFDLLIDFDEHLDNPTLNWMINPQFTLAHV